MAQPVSFDTHFRRDPRRPLARPSRPNMHSHAHSRGIMRIRHSWSIVVAVAALSLLSRAAHAQSGADDVGPKGGTWGAEATLGGPTGVSLLRLTSPQAAWLLGASFSAGRETSDQFNGFTRTRETRMLGSVELRVGRRWWSGEARERLKPHAGLGLIGRYASYPSARSWAVGPYGELGATYFFGPHLSLGTSGELAITRSRDTYSGGLGTDLKTDRWYINGNLVRFNAAVYF
jgi:hypothetical protein